MIVLPGFVETHWHMWNTLFRGMSGEKPDYGYFRTALLLGKLCTADDIYQGTRLATAEAINSGITFVHDWAHNIRSPDYARADLRALQGVRPPRPLLLRAEAGPRRDNRRSTCADLEKLKNDWAQYSNDGLIALGIAWRGHGGNLPANAVPENVWRAEYEASRSSACRSRSTPAGPRPRSARSPALAKANMIDKVQVIHAIYATAEEITAMKAAGTSVSFAPTSELRIGFGIPPVAAFLDAGVPIGLSVDTVELVGNADMFAIMKTIAGHRERQGRERVQGLGAPRPGARHHRGRALHGHRRQGRLAETRQARRPHDGLDAGRRTSACSAIRRVMLVTAAQPANVDTVMVDGRILKRGGKLTHLNVDRIAKEAGDASAALRKRANWNF